ncbi:MAG: methyltransferase domain-containing protein [Saprospiraceae bacterium]|nr:methyltransferase domain-containing protein [Saprospiraceae bacterium]
MGIKYFLLLVFLSSCSYFDKNGPLTLNDPPVPVENDFSSDSTESDLISDRTIWQKPYLIMDALNPLDQKVVADIGAGSGYFAFRFIHQAKKVIAIEIDKELIDLMNAEKEYYKTELQQKFEARLATAEDPMLKDQEADIIFISNTYTYFGDRINYLKNLRPKLREGGMLVIVDFKKKITPIGPPMEQRLAQGEVESELILAGYHITKSDDISLQHQYLIIAQAN